jgi:hypothetical protein
MDRLCSEAAVPFGPIAPAPATGRIDRFVFRHPFATGSICRGGKIGREEDGSSPSFFQTTVSLKIPIQRP